MLGRNLAKRARERGVTLGDVQHGRGDLTVGRGFRQDIGGVFEGFLAQRGEQSCFECHRQTPLQKSASLHAVEYTALSGWLRAADRGLPSGGGAEGSRGGGEKRGSDRSVASGDAPRVAKKAARGDRVPR